MPSSRIASSSRRVAVEIDPVALLEIGLRFARNDGRQMEYEIGARGDERLCRAGGGQIGGNGLDSAVMGHWFRLDHVGQREFGNLFSANMARLDEAGGELAADHPCGSDNQNMHAIPSD